MVSFVLPLHITVGVLLLAGTLALSIWAFVLNRRQASLTAGFWRFGRAVAGLLALQIVFGIVMLIGKAPLATPLHLMYAFLVLLGVGVHESFGRRARKEPKAGDASVAMFMAVMWFILCLLTLRAAMTGG
ncbi:MAG TPA: hypothetical protein VFK80_06720 [Limnochordia bacterium]|nr:hypothetical protein [Limnochordia bacterium]